MSGRTGVVLNALLRSRYGCRPRYCWGPGGNQLNFWMDRSSVSGRPGCFLRSLRQEGRSRSQIFCVLSLFTNVKLRWFSGNLALDSFRKYGSKVIWPFTALQDIGKRRTPTGGSTERTRSRYHVRWDRPERTSTPRLSTQLTDHRWCTAQEANYAHEPLFHYII